MLKMIKTYDELLEINTYKDRFLYLKLNGGIGEQTFGGSRYLNQAFYRSKQWRDFRNRIICRDNGLDMACSEYEINGRIIVHHINPITKDDVIHERLDKLLDDQNVVCVSMMTHEAIHFGDESFIFEPPKERFKFDTAPWRL